MKITTKEFLKNSNREDLIAKLIEDHGWRDGFSLLESNILNQGKTTFILLEPTLRIWGDILGSNIEFAGGEKLRFEGPFDAFQGELITTLWNFKDKIELPIIAGYINYEVAHLLESIPYPSNDPFRMPLYAFFAYRKIVEIPADLAQSCKVHIIESEWSSNALWQVDLNQSDFDKNSNFSQIAESIIKSANESDQNTLSSCEIYSNFSETEYRSAVAQAQEWIKAGDVYQVNFTQRFELPYEGSAELYYLILRKINPSANGAFLRYSGFPGVRGFAIASVSPELFMHSDGSKIQVSPIKGTAPRGDTEEQDLINMQKLRNSDKNLAELCMIVDLMRNDLSKVADSGTVKVLENVRLDTHPTLHHLVSDVECKRRDDVSFLDIIKALFPCGSITGAPKIAAMKCISHLEKTTRGVYCGAIGYIGAGGIFKFNVAIRTALLKDKKILVAAGGGIVADSIPSDEYQESLTKAKSLLLSWRLAQNNLVQETKDLDQKLINSL